MNAQRDGFDPQLERALGGVPRPVARPEFRSSLRDRFLDITAESSPGLDSPASPAERTRILPFLLPLLIAASVFVIVRAVLVGETPRRWTVLESSVAGTVVIDGIQIETTNQALLLDRLATAGEIETKDASLRIKLSNDLVLELAPRTKVTKMTFPAAGLWSVRTEVGSLRCCTGPTFAGKHMRVFTDDIELGVTGTIFAVDVEHKGTCVCCLDGRIDATPKGDVAAKAIEPQKMCFAFHEAHPALWGDAVEQHMVPLRDLQTWSTEHWKR